VLLKLLLGQGSEKPQHIDPYCFRKISMIPMDRAYWCQNCNMVGNVSTHCPACTSSVLVHLGGLFEREEVVFISGQPRPALVAA